MPRRIEPSRTRITLTAILSPMRIVSPVTLVSTNIAHLPASWPVAGFLGPRSNTRTLHRLAAVQLA